MKPRTERHPLYGAIPLLEHNSKGRNGIVHTWYQYDPAFKPALPKNAVRGDVARQMYCPAHYVQKYFYVDEQKTCVQCHEAFVFSAKEKKFWYESLQFNFNSTAIRCRSCGRRRQTDEHFVSKSPWRWAACRASRRPNHTSRPRKGNG